MELGGKRNWNAVIHSRREENETIGFVSFDLDFSSTSSLPKLPPITLVAEGMNEFGLTVSVQTHRQAIYQSAASTSVRKPRILINELARKFLEKCRTVAEARDFLDTVVVVGNAIPEADRIHWSLVDANQNTLIVEYLAGELVTRENIAGEFTKIATTISSPRF